MDGGEENINQIIDKQWPKLHDYKYNGEIFSLTLLLFSVEIFYFRFSMNSNRVCLCVYLFIELNCADLFSLVLSYFLGGGACGISVATRDGIIYA